MLAPFIMMGGTFDPVHFGHLRSAYECWQLFGRHSTVHMTPCGDPRHRPPPGAPAAVRFALLEKAVDGIPGLIADPREVRREGATYTYDTLLEIRREVGASRPVILAMGMDAFLGLPKWHKWVEIIELAHIMVIKRPNWSINERGELSSLLASHLISGQRDLLSMRAPGNMDLPGDQPESLPGHSPELCEPAPANLHTSPMSTPEHAARDSHAFPVKEMVSVMSGEAAGHIGFVELTQMAISATDIRRQIGHGEEPRFLLPDIVWQEVKCRQLYGYQPTPTATGHPGGFDQSPQ